MWVRECKGRQRQPQPGANETYRAYCFCRRQLCCTYASSPSWTSSFLAGGHPPGVLRWGRLAFGKVIVPDDRPVSLRRSRPYFFRCLRSSCTAECRSRIAEQRYTRSNASYADPPEKCRRGAVGNLFSCASCSAGPPPVTTTVWQPRSLFGPSRLTTNR